MYKILCVFTCFVLIHILHSVIFSWYFLVFDFLAYSNMHGVNFQHIRTPTGNGMSYKLSTIPKMSKLVSVKTARAFNS